MNKIFICLQKEDDDKPELKKNFYGSCEMLGSMKEEDFENVPLKICFEDKTDFKDIEFSEPKTYNSRRIIDAQFLKIEEFESTNKIWID